MSDQETIEDSWIAEQRKVVEDYLRDQGVDHRGVGEYPAFHVYPYLALWAVQSKKTLGMIGWWAISGDVPTDYISGSEGRHPRIALRAFAREWRKLSGSMLRGEERPDYVIGTRDQWPILGDLLQRRAEILQDYADDADLWNLE